MHFMEAPGEEEYVDAEPRVGDPWSVFSNHLVFYKQGCEGTLCFLLPF